jgi:two-component system cell cycle sensor histidine kinase PleC
MSHELRTPLNAIIGFSEFMRNAEKDGISDARLKEFSSYIHNASVHLLKVFNSVIDISKIHSGSMVLDRQEISVSEILQPCIKMLSGDGQAAIREEIESDLPNIFADIVKLKQVFTNILENALKFTPPEGTVTVSAESVAGNRVKIVFSDTGKGMSAAEAKIAATAFAQAKGELTSKTGGLGLGLAIAKALVELHGGSLRISTKQGVGTDVAIILPLCAGATDEARSGPANPDAPAPGHADARQRGAA